MRMYTEVSPFWVWGIAKTSQHNCPLWLPGPLEMPTSTFLVGVRVYRQAAMKVMWSSAPLITIKTSQAQEERWMGGDPGLSSEEKRSELLDTAGKRSYHIIPKEPVQSGRQDPTVTLQPLSGKCFIKLSQPVFQDSLKQAMPNCGAP